jgi:hypothetical protein
MARTVLLEHASLARLLTKAGLQPSNIDGRVIHAIRTQWPSADHAFTE